MSHFTVLVCLTEAEYRSDMRGNLAKRLAPFDENFSTPPYVVRCDCAEWAHRRLVNEAVQAKLNYTYSDLRESFRPLRAIVVSEYFAAKGEPEPEYIGFMEEPEDLDELIQVAWDKHRQEIEDTEAAFTASIPVPAPRMDCEDCHGTGLHESTYNPQQFNIDFCSGMGYNPVTKWIGDKNAKGNQVACTRRDEVLSAMWSNEAIRQLSDSTQDGGRKIQLLFSLHEGEEQKETSRTETTVDANGEIQHNCGTIHGDARSAGGQMCDLPEVGNGNEIHEQQQLAVSRPQPSDWESARTFMRGLQHSTGAIGGKLRHTPCNDSIPHEAHIVNRYNVGGAKWDWYSIGGRWSGHLIETVSDLSPMPNQDTAIACELAGKYQAFAIVDTLGNWHEKGQMGWFGMASNEMKGDEWKVVSEGILKAQPQGAIAVLVDCHI